MRIVDVVVVVVVCGFVGVVVGDVACVVVVGCYGACCSCVCCPCVCFVVVCARCGVRVWCCLC